MKPSILIVEDELIIALDLKEILTEEGYDTITNINNVNDAIIAIETQNPSLVLIDINLKQDKDGIDLGHYLLQKDTIPFIYITSYSNKTTLQKASETRPHGYIVKPFKPEDIKISVAIVLNNFRHRNIDVVRKNSDLNDEIPFILKTSIDYINQNITNKIQISDLTNLTRWDSQHFNRVFTKYIGVTPYKYILDKKVEYAKTLLADTSIPITQVSYELGFKSHSNFCAAFKKIAETTPENYRRQYEVRTKFLK